MSSMNDAVAVAGGLWSKSVAFFSLSFLLVSAQPGLAQEEPLKFFKNYFVAGDYVVGGASLWRKGKQGFATADIDISGVPPNVDILAAFLYVQTAEKRQWTGIAGATFEGVDLGLDTDLQGASIAKALTSVWDLAPQPCWTTAFPGGRKLVTYRADVLRFLPIDNREFLSRKVKNPNFRKHLLNGSHRVVVPDSGPHFGDDDEHGQEREGVGPRAVGASLVVVYRDPRQLVQKAVVIYDGGHVKPESLPMIQTIQGFYQAAITNPQAKMTHIVGDGRPLRSERVSLVGKPPLPGGTNPFVSSNGPKWDNVTFYNLPGLGGAALATVRIDSHGALHDCLQYSAIVFSTTVQDGDSDGLVDIWESSSSPLYEPGDLDPTGQPLPGSRPLPNLKEMGASPNRKDLFVEIGSMWAPDLTYGGRLRNAHTHFPSLEALTMVGDAFRNAPVSIKVHFDVGNNYQGSDYIIDANLARGGEEIDERDTVCEPGTGTPPRVCQYSPTPDRAYPGTVGWKTGFRLLRDGLLNRTEAFCQANPGDPDCDRRFDPNRRNMFRYALFAHALGIPKEPCLKSDGSDDPDCQDEDDFHVPRSFSGIADFPGGDLLVTLGAFDDSNGDPVGTHFMQASTLLHELGHTFGLTHAGALALPPLMPGRTPALPAREPNCKPNYLSVMSYLFQLRGLIKNDVDTGVPVAVLDLSRQRFGALPEFAGLPELDGLGTSLDSPGEQPLYRTGWYAPLETSYLKAPSSTAPPLGTAAKKHCDGSELLRNDMGELVEPPMVRVDGTAIGGPIDWEADGDTTGTPSQDVNFNGQTAALRPGSNDWANIRLNELGGRRMSGGLFLDNRVDPPRLTMGPMSLDVGNADIGNADIGNADIGNADIGNADIGNGDIGNGDVGNADIGNADIGRGLFGGGDDDVGGENEPFGEVDFEIAQALGNAPPSGLRACVVDNGSCTDDGEGLRVRLDWTTPFVGTVAEYEIYRVVGDTVIADVDEQPRTLVVTLYPEYPYTGPPPTTYVDNTVDWDTTYTYFVISVFNDGSESAPATRATSNFATVTTPDNF